MTGLTVYCDFFCLKCDNGAKEQMTCIIGKVCRFMCFTVAALLASPLDNHSRLKCCNSTLNFIKASVTMAEMLFYKMSPVGKCILEGKRTLCNRKPCDVV